MNTYNMDKMYESYASGMETMQMWLDESEQENKQLKDKIDKAIKLIEKAKERRILLLLEIEVLDISKEVE